MFVATSATLAWVCTSQPLSAVTTATCSSVGRRVPSLTVGLQGEELHRRSYLAVAHRPLPLCLSPRGCSFASTCRFERTRCSAACSAL